MTKFTQLAPSIMTKLMKDFDLDKESAAAIIGNAGHESAGFVLMQELVPIVKGSRGGYGWFQWTGPRRKAFEAYCARNNLDPTSEKANYGFLFVELKTTEAKAIPAVKAAKGLEAKTKAFENAFERSGVKHYPSRYNYAHQALKAYEASYGAAETTAVAVPAVIGGTIIASTPDYFTLPWIGITLATIVGLVMLVRIVKQFK